MVDKHSIHGASGFHMSDTRSVSEYSVASESDCLPKYSDSADFCIRIYHWLVISTPLKISQLGWLFPTYGKLKNVPTTNQNISEYHGRSDQICLISSVDDQIMSNQPGAFITWFVPVWTTAMAPQHQRTKVLANCAALKGDDICLNWMWILSTRDVGLQKSNSQFG